MLFFKKTLPLVLHLFREAHKIFDFDFCSVVQDGGAGEAAEDLVLVAFQDLEVGVGGTVDDGGEVHLKPVVVAGEGPGLQVILLFALHGDVEAHLRQLMGAALVKEHIFRGGGGVAEAVSDVEAEGLAVRKARGGAPVPGVAVRPHAPAPVQHAEGIRGFEGVCLRAQLHGPGGAHTVDLLVVVEMTRLLKGRADDHGLLRLVGECHVHVNGVRAPKFFHVGDEGAFAIFHRKLQLVPLALDGGDAAGGSGGQAGFAHGEDPHGAFCDLPGRPLKAEEGHGVKPHVAVVGDGERYAEPVVAHIVVIPLFEPGKAAPDRAPVIDREQLLGVPRLCQISPAVQQGYCFCDLVLHGDTSFVMAAPKVADSIMCL